MKKLYLYLFAAILPILGLSMASCDDDDNMPNVSISFDFDQGTVVDGTVYVVQGDTVGIKAIDIVNNEAGKGAAITNVNYYWDGMFYAPAIFEPFAMIFPTSENTPLGDHTISATCSVLAVDKTLASAIVNATVRVVASADDIPTPTSPASTITKTASLK